MTQSTTTHPIDDSLREVLSDYPQVELAILFGSCAAGRAGPNSDLDVAIQAKKPMDAELKLALITDLATHFGRPVDLVDLRTVGEPLLGEIFKGRRILGSDAAYARLLTRHLLDVADFFPYRQRILQERRKRWIES